jgi:hypothetical protein
VKNEKYKLKDQRTTETDEVTKQLESADEHIQLAVDLIYLLESNKIDPNVVVKALDIVSADFNKKLNK